MNALAFPDYAVIAVFFAVMLGVCAALFLFGAFGKRLNRVQGALLLLTYIAYTAYLVTQHA